MKSLDTPKYSGMLDIVSKIYRYEGYQLFEIFIIHNRNDGIL